MVVKRSAVLGMGNDLGNRHVVPVQVPLVGRYHLLATQTH